MKVIIANGPPLCGKDTFCNVIRAEFPEVEFIPLSYKEILYVGVATRYGLTRDAVCEMNADPETKDEPSDLFGGKSVRQALIFESEEVIKKKHGPQGVAILTFRRLKAKHGRALKDATLLCSDGGFNTELAAMYVELGIEPKDVYIARVDREGCSFEGDSREYLHHPDVTIENNAEIDDLKQHIVGIKDFLENRVGVETARVHAFRRLAKMGTFDPKVVTARNLPEEQMLRLRNRVKPQARKQPTSK